MSRNSRAQPPSPVRYFNSSPEVIRLVVLRYVLLSLSLRNVDDLQFERGIDLCHERCSTGGTDSDRSSPLTSEGCACHGCEAAGTGTGIWTRCVRVNGEIVYLWRVVHHEGEALEGYVTIRRDKSAALRFINKALKRHGSAEAIMIDGLRSYPSSKYWKAARIVRS